MDTLVRLLVVDDDPTMLYFLRQFLSRARPDIEITEAASGEEALRALDQGTFDGVLTDYRMGSLSGTDVLTRALERQPTAARILMCGALDPAIVADAQERARPHACIEKPMTLDELEAILGTAVDRHVARRPRGA